MRPAPAQPGGLVAASMPLHPCPGAARQWIPARRPTWTGRHAARAGRAAHVARRPAVGPWAARAPPGAAACVAHLPLAGPVVVAWHVVRPWRRVVGAVPAPMRLVAALRPVAWGQAAGLPGHAHPWLGAVAAGISRDHAAWGHRLGRGPVPRQLALAQGVLPHGPLKARHLVVWLVAGLMVGLQRRERHSRQRAAATRQRRGVSCGAAQQRWGAGQTWAGRGTAGRGRRRLGPLTSACAGPGRAAGCGIMPGCSSFSWQVTTPWDLCSGVISGACT
jgi:hypothetical protein